jgi:ribokinase
MVFIGPLHQDYVIGPHKDIYSAQPGGSAMYAAVGARVWVDEPLAIVSRIGEDFPQAWLRQLQSMDISCEAVRVVAGAASTRAFYEYRSDGEVNEREPRLAFARAGVALPKELLAYSPPGADEDVGDRFAPLAIRPEDLPRAQRQVRAAYLAPAHIVTHMTLPAPLRSGGATTIALSPSPRYLLPTSLHLLRPLLRGISILLLNERMARGLFREATRDLAEIAQRLASYGCPLVVVLEDSGSQILYRVEDPLPVAIPAYPADHRNPVGAEGAFAGGFLAGWHISYNPLQAALYGNISASLCVEGPGALFAFSRMKGLAEARLEWLRAKINAA